VGVGTGEVVMDFGTGADLVTTQISRATVTVNTHVEAYLFPKDTADHSADEQIIDPPNVFAYNVVAGVGFSITAASPPNQAMRGPNFLQGKYNIRWVSTE
jgi:hypothetical protein